jgi:TPR repeat protein
LQNAFQKHRPDNPTVLASSQTPADASKFYSADSASPAQLRQLAGQGDPAAENALGLLYAQGDELHGVKPDESEAARWFLKAAEQNYVPAQSKLGALYWGGRGVPANLNQAYFWTVLARAAGDPGSKTLAPVLASHMTRAQAATIEQQAEIWYQQHESNPKARPDH